MTLFALFIGSMIIGIVGAAIDASKIGDAVRWAAAIFRAAIIGVAAMNLDGDTTCRALGFASSYALHGLLYRPGYHFFTWTYALSGPALAYDAAYAWIFISSPRIVQDILQDPRRIAIATEVSVWFVGASVYVWRGC